MARFLTKCLIIPLLATVSTVLGCGVMPAGQASTRTFTVSGFTLPVAMVYSASSDVRARVPGIAADMGGAQAFVSRLVMQTVFDVLESQARSALLPDGIISSILGQLEVRVNYRPLQCKNVISPEKTLPQRDSKEYCIIVDNTVTGICTTNMATNRDMCAAPDGDKVKVTAVPSAQQTISGTLSTSNIIMANWSRTMWQNVVNRAVRMLALGPFRSHFFSASATVGGN
ncbi:hypothetical protein KIN20_032018 [Parelaphostrongylus tenuis]|uniref:Secreted protein n=1 Tax=Parelaphostrongylus tenuis TaxID=148309 RepID=A0AAD5R6B4_PARTN|nr:hypothetical protein KIN20_032018 [Parelaphostrongylus tenuis]